MCIRDRLLHDAVVAPGVDPDLLDGDLEAEPSRVTVPDVVGRSQNAATKTLSGRGFEVAVEEVRVDSRRDDGIVQEQSPAGGDEVERGSTVTITVGRFDADANPPPVTTTTPPASTTTTPAAPGPGQ